MTETVTCRLPHSLLECVDGLTHDRNDFIREAIEEKVKRFARSVGIDFDELDLLLWYTKTGEILK